VSNQDSSVPAAGSASQPEDAIDDSRGLELEHTRCGAARKEEKVKRRFVSRQK
jgi:hypothetical protein